MAAKIDLVLNILLNALIRIPKPLLALVLIISAAVCLAPSYVGSDPKWGDEATHPYAIYFILEPHSVYDSGHSAIVVPNTAGGYTYYSWEPNPSSVTSSGSVIPATGVLVTSDWPTVDAAMTWAKSVGYDRQMLWNIDAEHAAAGAAAAAAFAGTTFNVSTNNCWKMTIMALQAAGTPAQNYGSSPNYNWKKNLPAADWWSHL